MASGEYNRKHNKRITKPCPICGNRVIVANHGGTWWVACDADRTHIKQVFFHEPIDAIRWWNARTNADRIRAMSDEELAEWMDCDYGGLSPWCRLQDECPHLGEEETRCYDCMLEWLKKEVDDG